MALRGAPAVSHDRREAANARIMAIVVAMSLPVGVSWASSGVRRAQSRDPQQRRPRAHMTRGPWAGHARARGRRWAVIPASATLHTPLGSVRCGAYPPTHTPWAASNTSAPEDVSAPRRSAGGRRRGSRPVAGGRREVGRPPHATRSEAQRHTAGSGSPRQGAPGGREGAVP